MNMVTVGPRFQIFPCNCFNLTSWRKFTCIKTQVVKTFIDKEYLGARNILRKERHILHKNNTKSSIQFHHKMYDGLIYKIFDDITIPISKVY